MAVSGNDESKVGRWERSMQQREIRISLATVSKDCGLTADQLAVLAERNGFELERAGTNVFVTIRRQPADGLFHCTLGDKCGVKGKRSGSHQGGVKLESAIDMRRHCALELKQLADAVDRDALRGC